MHPGMTRALSSAVLRHRCHVAAKLTELVPGRCSSMVTSWRLRLVRRRLVSGWMGDMASKAQMPTPDTALPGRTDSIKVSGETEPAS